MMASWAAGCGRGRGGARVVARLARYLVLRCGRDVVSVRGSAGREERLRRYWDKHAGSYDRDMRFFDQHLFGDSRPWVCSQASGQVLEVAIGTGLNLSHYPPGVRLTGVEWSPAMLGLARRRAADLGVSADLRQGDAQTLGFPDASFDTVVCTFSLCAIPDDRLALREMARVLRPGGLLLLADHIEAGPWPVRAVQRLIELVSVPIGGEHFRRRPIIHVRAMGLTVEAHERFKLGIVERVAARKPIAAPGPGGAAG
jgi:ubiquinone/menaquinone biosynthesis C-methylase UbiE